MSKYSNPTLNNKTFMLALGIAGFLVVLGTMSTLFAKPNRRTVGTSARSITKFKKPKICDKWKSKLKPLKELKELEEKYTDICIPKTVPKRPQFQSFGWKNR